MFAAVTNLIVALTLAVVYVTLSTIGLPAVPTSIVVTTSVFAVVIAIVAAWVQWFYED